ncbi:MAG: DUF3108 domain-containing protein [Fibrobacteria bacterium]|nr:DUF3108 domain-containing protein [Fibrobacteria bacterium]
MVFALCGAIPALGARPAAESLGFEVFWGGMLVGRSRIDLLPTTDSTQMVVRTTAKANNAIQSFYPVRDTVESWVNWQTGLPLTFHKRLNEGSYSASVKLSFDRQAGKALVRGGQKKGGAVDTIVEIPEGAHDLLSAFLAVRRARLEPGESLHLPMLDNRKVFKDVEVRCLRRETLKTDLGSWSTLVIEPRLHGDALFQSKGKLTIWLTDDDRRIPVRMTSAIKLGTIRADLVDHTP